MRIQLEYLEFILRNIRNVSEDENDAYLDGLMRTLADSMIPFIRNGLPLRKMGKTNNECTSLLESTVTNEVPLDALFDIEEPVIITPLETEENVEKEESTLQLLINDRLNLKYFSSSSLAKVTLIVPKISTVRLRLS